MKIQVLVAAMHQNDESLVKKMNICTDAVIGNQCDRCTDEEYTFEGYKAVYYNRTDRGVGLNRNTALLHSSGDILLFADEDVVYCDGYDKIIQRAFEELPKADAIIFNINTVGADVGRRKNTKIKRVRIYNALNYNTPRIAVRAKSIKRSNIVFHTCFGGGTMYNAGEDTLFITSMLKNHLRIYTYPVCIADEYQYESTWFKGYDRKFLHDKGVLFAAISKKWAKPLCLQALVRHKEMYKQCNLSFTEAYKLMKTGIKSFKTLSPYSEAKNRQDGGNQ